MIPYGGVGAIYVAIIVPGVMAAVSPIVRPIATTILATFGITPAVWIVTATAMLVGLVGNYTKGPQHQRAILVAISSDQRQAP